jgi:hypothetical protein
MYILISDCIEPSVELCLLFILLLFKILILYKVLLYELIIKN